MAGLTFRAECLALYVEDASAQCHLLQDDAKAVDISFLCSACRRAAHPQQLRSHPQLPYNKVHKHITLVLLQSPIPGMR